MITWVQEIVSWAPIAVAWLTTTTIGTAIYFLPMAQWLDALME